MGCVSMDRFTDRSFSVVSHAENHMRFKLTLLELKRTIRFMLQIYV